MEAMDKIPKDLKRWLKDNGRYTEFLRLIKVCGYTVKDLTHTHIVSAYYDGVYRGRYEYDIKKWFNTPSNEKYIVTKDKNVVEYSLFLDKLKLNWK